MSDFDYGNPRLRAMKARLLTTHDLESMAESTSLEALIAALSKTPYQEKIKEALSHTHGIECIQLALRLDLLKLTYLLQTYYPGKAGDAIGTLLWDYDIQNIKAILRGLTLMLPLEDILSALLPAGVISEPVLHRLAHSANIGDALSTIVTLQLPFSSSILKSISTEDSPDPKTLEAALENWYFTYALEQTDHLSREDAKILRHYFQTQADHINLSLVLRMVGNPIQAERLEQKLMGLMVHSGSLSLDFLKELLKQENLDQAVELCNKTAYYSVLQTGLRNSKLSAKRSQIEDALRLSLLNWAAKLIPEHPLGIGVPLGYLTLKRNEVRNLRWISLGILEGIPSAEIINGLEKVL
jgi:ATP synthase A1 C subunit